MLDPRNPVPVRAHRCGLLRQPTRPAQPSWGHAPYGNAAALPDIKTGGTVAVGVLTSCQNVIKVDVSVTGFPTVLRQRLEAKGELTEDDMIHIAKHATAVAQIGMIASGAKYMLLDYSLATLHHDQRAALLDAIEREASRRWLCCLSHVFHPTPWTGQAVFGRGERFDVTRQHG